MLLENFIRWRLIRKILLRICVSYMLFRVIYIQVYRKCVLYPSFHTRFFFITWVIRHQFQLQLDGSQWFIITCSCLYGFFSLFF